MNLVIAHPKVCKAVAKPFEAEVLILKTSVYIMIRKQVLQISFGIDKSNKVG